MPRKHATCCKCENPKLRITNVGYKRGTGLVDFYCCECGHFRVTKALDDLTPRNRRRLRFLMRRTWKLERDDDE